MLLISAFRHMLENLLYEGNFDCNWPSLAKRGIALGGKVKGGMEYVKKWNR
jgi:hypothetical protein